MHAANLSPCFFDRTLETRTINDFLAILGERLGRSIMHDTYFVAHGVPKYRAPLVDREVRIIKVRQTYDVRAKIEVQECLLGLSWWVPSISYAREQALVRRVVWVEYEHASVEVELEAQVLVYVWDGAEWEWKIEELIKVASDERVSV